MANRTEIFLASHAQAAAFVDAPLAVRHVPTREQLWAGELATSDPDEAADMLTTPEA